MSMSTNAFSVDFSDRQDVRAKLPRARSILKEKEAALAEVQSDFNAWRRYVALLIERAEDEPDECPESNERAHDPQPVRESVQASAPEEAGAHLDLVVSAVEQNGEPIRARDVAKLLRTRGITIEKSAVSNALYYAANRATPPRIKKMPARGTYAPLTYDPMPLMDYSHAAEQGFPVADHLPANDDPDGRA